MQINGSFPLQFLNNPHPGQTPDTGQPPGHGAQNNAINPSAAVNAATQARPAVAAANTAVQTGSAAGQTGEFASKPNVPRRLDIFA